MNREEKILRLKSIIRGEATAKDAFDKLRIVIWKETSEGTYQNDEGEILSRSELKSIQGLKNRIDIAVLRCDIPLAFDEKRVQL